MNCGESQGQELWVAKEGQASILTEALQAWATEVAGLPFVTCLQGQMELLHTSKPTHRFPSRKPCFEGKESRWAKQQPVVLSIITDFIDWNRHADWQFEKYCSRP